ncbi:hypothetical protein POM88_029694 [Heracleum sosnowskyi]|uniref:Uncharacterized protein n=1 Tax=Heracleum sosnowskyi TaxID=360622 RepID=A0AAD8MHD5_9APIA|nr:hypothetical protein POM88_029694 [Heracleum sosnowskyi]
MDFLTPPTASLENLTITDSLSPPTTALQNLTISNTDTIKTYRKLCREGSQRRALIKKMHQTLKSSRSSKHTDLDPHTTNIVSSEEKNLKQLEHQLRSLKELGNQEFSKSIRMLCMLADKIVCRAEQEQQSRN